MDTFQSCQKENLKMTTYRYILDSTATWAIPVTKFGIFVDAWPSLISVVAIISAVQQYRHQPPLRGAKIMVYLRGMVRSAWYKHRNYGMIT